MVATAPSPPGGAAFLKIGGGTTANRPALIRGCCAAEGIPVQGVCFCHAWRRGPQQRACGGGKEALQTMSKAQTAQVRDYGTAIERIWAAQNSLVRGGGWTPPTQAPTITSQFDALVGPGRGRGCHENFLGIFFPFQQF